MRNLILLISIISIFISCTSKHEVINSTNKKNELIKEIQNFERELYNDLELDIQKAEKMICLYTSFTIKYNEDTLTPEYLYKAAEISFNIKNGNKACSLLKQIEQKHPKFDKYAESIYFLGYIYDSLLDDKELAKQYYNHFITKYPKHFRSEEVKFLLKNIEKSDLEIIREFEKMN